MEGETRNEALSSVRRLPRFIESVRNASSTNPADSRSWNARRVPPGLFANFGCRDGGLLKAARGLDWRVAISEMAWPAPSRIGAAEGGVPRLLALWALRKALRAASTASPRLGSRYFYVERW